MTTSTLITKPSIEHLQPHNPVTILVCIFESISELQCLIYIQYLTQVVYESVQVLIDSDSKINIMYLDFAKKLGL